MGRMAAYTALTHFRADKENRAGNLSAPVSEVLTDAEFLNPKDREILPGETRVINTFTTNPGFDAFVVIPRTPGAFLVVAAVKDSPTSGSNRNPSGNDQIAATFSAIYPFEATIPIGDVLVAPTATDDYGLNPADNLPLAWEGSNAVAGYWYRLIVHYPASVPDVTSWQSDAATPAVTFRTQTQPVLFTTMLVQGGE
jgi:hypothetical protein